MDSAAGRAIRPVRLPLVVDRFVPQPFKRNPAVFEFLVFAVFAGISFLIAFRAAESRPYLGLCLPIAFGFMSVPFGFRFAHRQLIDWAKSADSFTTEPSGNDRSTQKRILAQLSFLGGSIEMYVAGVALSGWTLLAFYLGGYFSNLNALQMTFFCVLTGLSAFLAGLGLYAIFEASRLIRSLGDGTYRILVRAHKFGILSTGRMLGRCYFVIALVCSMYFSSAVLGEKILSDGFRVWNPLIWMLVLPTAIFISVAFIAAQMPLHRQMVEFKKSELARIERRLDLLKRSIEKSVTGKLLDEIKLYEDQKTEALALPEWPFGLKGLLGIVGSSVTVVFPTLFNLVLQAAGISLRAAH
jgi:hypothetical protein